MSWARLLDDYEARIEALDRALREGEFLDLDPFAPPAEPLPAPTDAERDRFEHLHEVAGALQRRLLAARDSLWSDLGETRRRSQAARAYGAR